MPEAHFEVHPFTWLTLTGGLVSMCQVVPSVVCIIAVHVPAPCRQSAVPSAQPSSALTKVRSETTKFFSPPLECGTASVVTGLGAGVDTVGLGGCTLFETAGACFSALWCGWFTLTSA